MFRYNEGGEIMEIVVRDSSGAKIENYRFKINDPRVMQTINAVLNKYGVKKKDKDLDWLKKNSSW